MIPAVVFFDIDNTLVESSQPLAVGMAILLTALMRKTNVAIISSATLELFMKNIINQLPSDSEFRKTYLLPTCGAALYEYSLGEWVPVYEERLSEDSALRVRDALMEAAEKTGLIDFTSPSFGERIEYLGSHVTLSALGQDAPLPEKNAWDPDQSKRKKMLELLTPLLPGFEVTIGGATSIDITKRGVTKAFGVRKLSEHLSIPVPEMLYVGDGLFPGGNDEVVKETGVETRTVANPAETATVIKELLSSPA